MSRPWILIPVHNRREVTLGCLRHLSTLGVLRSFETIVIDDGSEDGTTEAIRHEFPAVRTLAGDGQLWWTGAIARGMAEADREGALAVVWLNDDCLPDAGALEELMAVTARHPSALCGASCVTAADATPVSSAFTGRSPHSAPAPGQSELAVDGLSGFCVAVPRDAWTALGFPDATRFPHYYGDTAYTLRARRAGFPVLLSGVACARLTHYEARADTVSSYVARLPAERRRRAEVFLSPRSPFRAATQWHYLLLRYGRVFGGVLAAARLVRWQVEFTAAARRGGAGSAAAP